MNILTRVIKEIFLKDNRVFYLISLLFGILIGFLIDNWTLFTINSVISLESIFSTLIGASFGFYIASILTKEQSNLSAIKNLLTNDLKELLQFTQELYSYFLQDDPMLKYVNINLKKISMLITAFSKLVQLSSLQNIDIESLNLSFFKLKQVLTDVQVDHDKICLDEAVYANLDTQFKEFKTECYSIIISITKQ